MITFSIFFNPILNQQQHYYYYYNNKKKTTIKAFCYYLFSRFKYFLKFFFYSNKNKKENERVREKNMF